MNPAAVGKLLTIITVSRHWKIILMGYVLIEVYVQIYIKIGKETRTNVQKQCFISQLPST
jgi:hypothetical protein